MKLKYIVFCSILPLLTANYSEAQFLKKLKEKASKTLGNDSSNDTKQETTASDDNEKQKETTTKVRWCDTVSVNGQPGSNGVQYTLAYSSPNNVSILYDESSLGLNSDGMGHRLILTEKVNNKSQFIVVENGKVVATDTEVKAKYLTKSSSQNNINDRGAERDAAMQKYIVGDTLKQDIPKSEARTVSIEKMDDEQLETVMQMARQTDDYKKLSDAEKKEFEANIKAGMAQHNARAGQKVDIPAQEGGTVAMVNGYKLIVKGKNYGKFQMPPIIDVSPDETKVFAVGVDDQSAPVMIVNGKKTPLDKNKYMAMSGYILRSPDLKKFVYIEQKKMSEKEIDEMNDNIRQNKEMKLQYSVLRSDGTSLLVTDHNSEGKFKLTHSGAVISINEKTGQVFADNKVVGKFPLQGRDRLESEAILLGNDVSQMAYYNGEEGSLTYLDGAVRKLDITYPKVISDKGKSYLTWFRKCKNDIYIARFAY